MSLDGVSQEELLYFGSVPVNFDYAPGIVKPYEETAFEESDAAELKELAHKRSEPVAYLGEGYEDLIVPAMPCTDLVLDSEKLTSVSINQLPELLRKPLMKVADGPFKGVASGIRSAMIKVKDNSGDDIWVRLKGCGNNYDRFPYREVDNASFPGCKEIRGCQFEHTTHRELFMSGFLDHILTKAGLPGSAIKPIGWFEYNLPDTAHPKVLRTCGVFRAMGEKRCGDHVLTGLETLLPNIVKDLDHKILRSAFPEDRQCSSEDYPEGVMPTFMNVIMGSETFLDATGIPVLLSAPTEPPPYISDTWKKYWTKTAKLLNALLEEKKPTNLLAYVFWRLGREMGTAVKVFHDNDVSWGTYADSLGVHCNAHTNNVVLMPQSEDPSAYWTTVLDMDMAYTRKSYAGAPSAEEKGKEATFDFWVALEAKSMKITLAGDEEISTGVTGTVALPLEMLMLKWALRDTIIAGYQSGYAGTKDDCPADPNLHEAAHALFRLALMATANHIA